MKYSTLPVIIFIIIAPFSSISQSAEGLSYPYIQLAQNTDPELNNAIRSIKQETGGRILSSKTVKKMVLKASK